MPPGTEIVQRVRRGDPPRSKSDRVALRHDIDYYMASGAKTKAKQAELIRKADKRMVSSLNRISKEKGDHPRNIALGRRLIQGKMMAENVGKLEKGSFGGDLINIPDNDKILMMSNRARLEQEGYGQYPAQALKMKLLKQHKKKKQKGGFFLIPNVGTIERKIDTRVRPKGSYFGKGIKKCHMMKINKCINNEVMKGKGIKDVVKGVVQKLAPIVKEHGPTIAKEVIIPLVKKKLEQKKGNGLSLAGKGNDTDGLEQLARFGRIYKEQLEKNPVGKEVSSIIANKSSIIANKIIKKLVNDKIKQSQRGRGLKLAGKGRVKHSMNKTYGTTSGHILTGKGINTAGQGLSIAGKGMREFIVKKVLPLVAKEVNVDIKGVPLSKIIPVVGRAIKLAKSGNLKEIAQNASKILLPVIMKYAMKGNGLKLAGRGIGEKIYMAIADPLASGVLKAIKWYLKNTKVKGNGLKLAGQGLSLAGNGWWDDFKKGFMTVVKPALQIGAPIAAATGNPLAAAAMTGISSVI